jgi:cytosine/adenosine deaminase-related metal-dependent hydrolase/SAM-dependent methyltransferase
MISVANISELAVESVHRQHYALWARDYDESPNPLLSLEERYLTPLLPALRNADVVDLGCGTGRWLNRIANSGANSLTGIDFSPEMLDRAKQKLGRRALLAVGNAISLPIASRSADLIIASFVASYVSDLGAFASELHRVVRRGGRIYLSDVHPETELSCHWKRGFRSGQERVRLATCSRSLLQILSYLIDAGLKVTSLLEPAFGPSEREVFRESGKLDAFDAATELPAIYILELRLSDSHSTISMESKARRTVLLRSRIALDAETAIVSNVEIGSGRVEAVRPARPKPCEDVPAVNELDLRGYLLLPGLINAHDHLEFGLYPNLGHPPYLNFIDWAADIQRRDSAVIAAHRSIPRDVRLWWGAIRNLLCGVTSVCHHNPLYPELLNSDFPVRVLKDYRWAHSLAVDPELAKEFKVGPPGVPFVIHASEGVDEQAESEIYTLDKLGVLNERTVLVHGLGLTKNGIDLLNRRSASLVWCPSSNQFLFGRTHTRGTIASIDHVLLGSDSPLTASGDLLDELRIAKHEVGVSATDLYRMVLETPVDVFQLKDGEGRVRAGHAADFIAVRDSGLSPATALANLTFADVELVVVRGRVQVASDRIFRRLTPELADGLRPLQVESVLRWVRAPLGRLFREAERALGCDIGIGGKRVRHVCTAWL